MSPLLNHADRGAGASRLGRALMAATSILGGALVAAPAAAAETWVRWADHTNGVPQGVYPRIAVASSTHSIFFSYRLPLPDMKGRVYRADMTDPGRKFTLMPQAGFNVPASVNNPQFNVFSMTTNAAGEPIVGLLLPGSYSTANKLLRFDSASQTWVQPALFAKGASSGVLAPNRGMYSLTRAPDGTIWGGHQFNNVSISTDGGKSFGVIDDAAYLKQKYPAFVDTGAIYGVVTGPNGFLYAATEIGGGVYSPDQGTTWLSLDAFWGSPSSPMIAARSLTNCAGIGVTADGKIVLQGGKPSDTSIPDDLVHLIWIDPVAKVVKSAVGVKPGLLGGQDVHEILTTASGDMFFIEANIPVQDPTYGEQGGVYTSKDGLNWHTFNTGVTWFKAQAPNGSAAATSLAVDGNDVFFATADGTIWHYNTVGNTMPPGGSTGSAGVGSGPGVVVGVGVGSGAGGNGGYGGAGGGVVDGDNSAVTGSCSCDVAGDNGSGGGMLAGIAAMALGLGRRRARRWR
jgi:hypothetical protein